MSYWKTYVLNENVRYNYVQNSIIKALNISINWKPGEIRNLTLWYYNMLTDVKVDIFENLTGPYILENGTRRVIYQLIIVNKEEKATIGSPRLFAAFEYGRFFREQNFTLTCYENGKLTRRLIDTWNGWVYPSIEVLPNRELNMTIYLDW